MRTNLLRPIRNLSRQIASKPHLVLTPSCFAGIEKNLGAPDVSWAGSIVPEECGSFEIASVRPCMSTVCALPEAEGADPYISNAPIVQSPDLSPEFYAIEWVSLMISEDWRHESHLRGLLIGSVQFGAGDGRAIIAIPPA